MILAEMQGHDPFFFVDHTRCARYCIRMKILGIETSCDDTAAALLESNEAGFVLHSNVVSSQIDIHKVYGGVVPEIAGRKHADTIVPVVREALSGVKPDVIAVTAGPGLVTSLVVGVEMARGLSYGWNDVPIVRTNHIEGHICSVLLGSDRPNTIPFPAIALVVSGGHTELILMRDHGVYELVGKTRDDAAGECFDKVAKLLGLEYPGGPKISALATDGRRDAIDLPRPMMDAENFEFSFAGLKTAALYYLRDHPDVAHTDFCASFEQAIVDVLVHKTIRAAKRFAPRTIILSGGVSANQLLRDTLTRTVAHELPDTEMLIPELRFTADNAAMIAMAGYFHAIKNDFTSWRDIQADPAWELV